MSGRTETIIRCERRGFTILNHVQMMNTSKLVKRTERPGRLRDRTSDESRKLICHETSHAIHCDVVLAEVFVLRETLPSTQSHT